MPDSDVEPTPVLGALSRSDAALALLTSIASAIPVVGGPAASVAAEMRRTFDRRQAERLAAVINDLAVELHRLGERIERDLGADGELATFLEAGIEAAATARNAEKRAYYVALMARAATVDGPEQVQRDHLLDTLDRLRHRHLVILHAVASGPAPAKMRDYYDEGTPAYRAVRAAVPGLDDTFLHRAWEDMVALGLLSSWTDYVVSDASPLDDTGMPVTAFGRAFLRFVSPF